MIENIPATTAEVVEKVPPVRRHPGLQLDKLSSAADQKGQKRALEHIVGCEGDGKLLESRARAERACWNPGSRGVVARPPDHPLTSLGRRL